MKFKKPILIVFLILAILSISIVSASDEIASDDLSINIDEDIQESSIDEDSVSVEENTDEVLASESEDLVGVEESSDDVLTAIGESGASDDEGKEDCMVECDNWYEMEYGTAKNIPIFLKDGNDKPLSGKTIYIEFKGVTYKKTTNSKGVAYFKPPTNLKPNVYFFKASFLGDSKYCKFSDEIGFDVFEIPKIALAKKTFKVKSAKKITVIIKTKSGKIMKNKKITLKISGKKFVKKTNSKGKVSFKVTKFLKKKGKYIAKIKFKGNAHYKTTNKQFKIRVK